MNKALILLWVVALFVTGCSFGSSPTESSHTIVMSNEEMGTVTTVRDSDDGTITYDVPGKFHYLAGTLNCAGQFDDFKVFNVTLYVQLTYTSEDGVDFYHMGDEIEATGADGTKWVIGKVVAMTFSSVTVSWYAEPHQLAVSG